MNHKKIYITLCLLLVISITAVVLYKDQTKKVLKKNKTVYYLLKEIKHTINTDVKHVLTDFRIRDKLPANITIVVNAEKTMGDLKPIQFGFGNDSFYEWALRSEKREFLKLVQQVNQNRKVFSIFRTHNIFSDHTSNRGKVAGGRVYSEDANGNPVYNWDRVDHVFDRVLAAGLKPIVEFGFMPRDLSSDPKRIGDWRTANVAPPKDYLKWQNLVFETVNHLQQRYGAEEIQNWHFEVWNEPDLWRHFWVEDPANKGKTDLNEYLKLYDYTVAGATAAKPDIKIGGPAIAGYPHVLEDFIKHVYSGKNFVNGQTGSKGDFLSFHKYGDVEKNLEKSKMLLDRAIKTDKRCAGLPFLLDEFGFNIADKRQWKNTTYYAAWICKLVDGFYELRAEKGELYCPDVMVLWSDVGQDFLQGSGKLITRIGSHDHYLVKGPAFNAFCALSYLRGDNISLKGTKFGEEIHGLATKNENEISILLYRINERQIEQDDTILVDLRIKNFPFKKSKTQLFLIDQNTSNGYTYWQKMGEPAEVSETQVKQLQTAADFAAIESTILEGQKTKTVSKKIGLRKNSVALLVFSNRPESTMESTIAAGN